MESYYSWRHTTALRAMRRTLNDYYDSDTAGMLRWMQLSIGGHRHLLLHLLSGGQLLLLPDEQRPGKDAGGRGKPGGEGAGEDRGASDGADWAVGGQA